MRKTHTLGKSAVLLVSCALLLWLWNASAAEESKAPAKAPADAKPVKMTPGGKWKAGDMNRPRPPVVEPGTASVPDKAGQPPSDAVILFDGKDLSQWETDGVGPDKGKKVAPRWKAENGYMEIIPKGGGISTKEKFGDCQIHIEWATPSEVKGNSQGRGNSGFFLGGHGEIQVLDSYQNDTYPDGQAAALYSKYPPLVNACRKPGEWQSYDVVFEAPRFDDKNQQVRPARVTLFHNGILAHHAVETGGSDREIQLSLQDHGNPVRYRNIWLRRLKGYDEQ